MEVGKMGTVTRLDIPAEPERIRALRIGDELRVWGRIITARDMAHKYLVEQRPESMKDLLRGALLYHCGPIMTRSGADWHVVAAGPTTSSREEPYEATVIEQYQIAGAIGKGGMGDKTSAALKQFGAVYLHAVGGAGSLLARCVKKVDEVRMLEEFGVPEAFWVLHVEDFPVVVTMDSEGGSLHRKVLKESEVHYRRLMGLT